MKEKILEKIKKLKEDNSVYKDYIKNYCKIEEVSKKDSMEIRQLKKYITRNEIEVREDY